MKKYYGKRVFDGIAIGNLVRINDSITYYEKEALGFEKEFDRFENARNKAIFNYKNIIANVDNNQKELLNSIISILEDLDLIDLVTNYLQNNNYSAEQAIDASCRDLTQLLSNLDNEYLKERVKDIQEACNKIIYYLQNKQNHIINNPVIVVAKEINVSTLMEIDKENILGLVLENISPNAHIAILARSLSIPTIASIEDAITFGEKSIAILDSSNGMLITSPDSETLKKYEEVLLEKERLKQELSQYKRMNIKTIDNKEIKIYSNISSSYEIDMVLECNADGIGLFRSEFLFINNKNFPTEEEQFQSYSKCVLKMKDKPTIIRTMDIGSDKVAEYFDLPKEKNPALGYRGIRIYEEYKDVFLTQLKALYRTSNLGNLKIMIPMITNIDEVKFVFECIEEAKKDLTLRNIRFNNNMEIGIMIETPASALICDELAKYVDFFSIGTNDLSQYTLAIDRENPKIANLNDYNHKAILRLIYHVAKTAKENNIAVGICGEMAREKELIGFYIKCGIDEISVSSSYVLECKKRILEIDTTKINLKDYI